MSQYQNTRSANLQGWDASGEGMIISTRFGETTQLHYVADPGGVRKQLTFFDERVTGAAVNPDPNSNEFLFTRDVGGGEFYQIFSFNMETGAHRLLTDGESRNGFIRWSNAGDKFAYYSTKRNGRDWDIFVAETTNPTAAELVYESSGVWVPIDWSPNDEQLLVLNYISINESYYHVLDVDSGELRPINATDEKIAYGSALWDKNGTGVYITSDQDSEFQRLRYYDLTTDQQVDLTSDIEWDVSEVTISPSGNALAFTTNEDGLSKLYLMDTGTQNSEAVANIPVGQVYGLEYNPDGSELALVINTPQTPGDIYTLDVNTQELSRWTYSEVGGLNTDQFIIPELIHFDSFVEEDGSQREIPAFYYKPRGAGPHPVLIYIHGGPESQFNPAFIATFQYYVNEMGMAVLAPNVRGSAGYGKSYLTLDNGFKREDSVKDIGALLDWVDAQPELDSERVGVMGGSYGGYMVLASMFHYNDRLKAGIDIVGISSFVTFLENTQDYRRDLRRSEYGDERDPEMRAFLEEISPLNNADQITSPMLIAQGFNDPRVPVGESEQMVAAIRENGGDVWYLLAMDEGHGFAKKTNRDYYNNAVVLFLQQNLIE